MRTNLKKLGFDEPHTYIATFSHTSTRRDDMDWLQETVLLTDVYRADTMEFMTDHLWFDYTFGFRDVKLQKGDRIQFEAKVESYERGYKGYYDGLYPPITIDYKLSSPKHIIKLDSENSTNL